MEKGSEFYYTGTDGILRKWNKEMGQWEYADEVFNGHPGATLFDKQYVGAKGSAIPVQSQDYAMGSVSSADVLKTETTGTLTISGPVPDDPLSTLPADMYKYHENEYVEEIAKYIDSTYSQHYSQNKFQATEFIIDGGHGTGFCIGNVLKYAQRYGRKGSPDDWRKDLMKVIHYAIIQLHVHDRENPKGEK